MIVGNGINLPTSLLEADFNRAARKSLLALFRQTTPHRENKTKTRRTSINCGWDYTRLKAGEKVWVEPAPVVTAVYQALKLSLEKENPGLTLPETFGNAIISYYGAKDCLQPHVDLNEKIAAKKGLKGFFGEKIIGVVIQADSQGRLFLDAPKGRLFLEEADGLCFVLEGAARDDLAHGITEVGQNRLSVTYRTVEFV